MLWDWLLFAGGAIAGVILGAVVAPAFLRGVRTCIPDPHDVVGEPRAFDEIEQDDAPPKSTTVKCSGKCPAPRVYHGES